MITAALLPLSLSLLLPASAAHEACAAADPATQAQQAIAVCADAAKEGDVAARIAALHALAEAHAALGHDEDASGAYIRLLVLSGTATPLPGASERARRAFAVSKNRLLSDAPIIVRAQPSDSDPKLFALTITDPERRIVTLVARGPGGETQPVPLSYDGEAWQGIVSVEPFVGDSARVAVELDATGWDGGPVSDGPVAVIVWPADERRSPGPVRPLGGAVLVGTGAVGLLLGVGTVATWASAAQDAALAEKSGDDLPACLGWCVGEKPYVLGVSGEDREALQQGAAPSWILTGVVVATTGALLVTAGIVLLVSGDE